MTRSASPGKQVLDRKLLSEADIEKLKAEIEKKIAQAVEWGLAQALPARADYLADVSGKYLSAGGPT